MATVGNYAILFHVMDEIVRIERVAYSCNGSHLKPAMLAFDAVFGSHYLQMSLHSSARARIPFLRAHINCK
jgi:hypothetical protein